MHRSAPPAMADSNQGGLTHLDARGQARMVGVGAKAETARGAIAHSRVRLSPESFALVKAGQGPKGDAIQVARIAAFSGVKRTADLIPMCHPLRIAAVEVDVAFDDPRCEVAFAVRVEAVDRTGVEMEAMTGAAIAALALYDMIKAVDRTATVAAVELIEKWGGKSGHFRRG